MLRRSGFIAQSARYSLAGTCLSLIATFGFSHQDYAMSSNWDGTWKLDAAKSRIYGPTLRISRSSDGVYHSSGRIGAANFDCDGKGHLVSKDDTISCTQRDADYLEISAFKNGSRISIAHWELSDHAKALTIQGTFFQPDGSTKTIESHFTRTSGAAGFVGGWRNRDLFQLQASTLRTDINNNALHIYYPERGIRVDVPIDGTSAAVNTPLFPSGATIALSKRGPQELSLITKLRGQTIYVEDWQIGVDGRSLTQSSWFAKTPNEKYVLVYMKE
jgi:hypothetical protein